MPMREAIALLLVLPACGCAAKEYDTCAARGDVAAGVTSSVGMVAPADIDLDGTVSSTSIPYGHRLEIDVDFSAASPETGVVQFWLPGWVATTTDLAPGDEVHVDYAWGTTGFWPYYTLTISRDGEMLVHGFHHFFAPESVSAGPLVLSLSDAGCEPVPVDHDEGCYEWIRMQYLVSCPDLPDPQPILDGTEATVPCGPGYRVAVENLVRHGEPLQICTDVPPQMADVMVARIAD